MMEDIYKFLLELWHIKWLTTVYRQSRYRKSCTKKRKSKLGLKKQICNTSRHWKVKCVIARNLLTALDFYSFSSTVNILSTTITIQLRQRKAVNIWYFMLGYDPITLNATTWRPKGKFFKANSPGGHTAAFVIGRR